MRAHDSLLRHRVRSFCALLGSCWLCSAGAHAQAPDPAAASDVELSIADCEGIPSAEIANLVALELAPPQPAPPAAAGHTPTRASMTCADARATITVTDSRRAEPLVLELSLSATPQEARARFLALAIAELIATSRLERVDAEPPPAGAQVEAPTPTPTPSAPAAPPAAASPVGPEPRWWLFLEAGAVRAFDPALFAPAIAAGASRSFAPFALLADVGYERGETKTPDAALTAHAVSLRLAPAWQFTAKPLTLWLALGMRGGYAWLAASAREAGQRGGELAGIFLTPISNAGLQARLTDHLAVRLELEFGYVVKPLRGLDANGAVLFELRGARMAALLGVAWAP